MKNHARGARGTLLTLDTSPLSSKISSVIIKKDKTQNCQALLHVYLRSFEKFSCCCTLLFDKGFKLCRSNREARGKQLFTINKPNTTES